ncbi:DUF3618 domain-containing protein [Mesorhizobium sp. B2-1-3A]|uniref:DUF3618 domain-containing protein n=1 Tax=Mesorhizobium sp. B2-1-3A TaxID=2589971 RepID=UPI00112EC016|nr:DUF3618 domain-containing protein [Mesorhizobium sp. B2-1-3A]TPM96660.1 DUF3618 domain-containing protein [Mesorhizobium sp. B2-1-3A]
MNGKSAAELEREAEAARARVVETAESIRGKMTPGQLLDEFAGIFSGGESSAMLTNLRTQVRDNPLPITMVGAGLAWLMFGNGTSNSRGPSAPGQHDEARGGGFGSTFSDAVESLSSAASSVGDTLSSTATGGAERLKSSTAGARSATGDIAAKAGLSGQELLNDQPLVVAAVGLAIGAAIGAMLPHTALEDEQLGSYGDKVRDKAEATFNKGLDEAKEVAAAAYETIKQEAGRQDMHGSTMADQLGDIVRSTADTAENSVRERFSNSGQEES